MMLCVKLHYVLYVNYMMLCVCYMLCMLHDVMYTLHDVLYVSYMMLCVCYMMYCMLVCYMMMLHDVMYMLHDVMYVT